MSLLKHICFSNGICQHSLHLTEHPVVRSFMKDSAFLLFCACNNLVRQSCFTGEKLQLWAFFITSKAVQFVYFCVCMMHNNKYSWQQINNKQINYYLYDLDTLIAFYTFTTSISTNSLVKSKLRFGQQRHTVAFLICAYVHTYRFAEPTPHNRHTPQHTPPITGLLSFHSSTRAHQETDENDERQI